MRWLCDKTSPFCLERKHLEVFFFWPNFNRVGAGFSSYPTPVVSTAERLRRGWPLLTVENEENENSKSTNKRGPWSVRWALHAGTRHFSLALAALVGPVQNLFFPHCTLFQFIFPHRPATWAGSRAGSPVSC